MATVCECGAVLGHRATCPMCGLPARATTEATLRFKNPSNGFVEEIRHPFFWALVFGCFYFLRHRAWLHAIVGFVLAWLTLGLSWLVYPFFARRIVERAYLGNGWRQL